MFPQIYIFGITIYTFGLALSIAFIMFFWMLHHISFKAGINTNFFIGNALTFFLSTFLFSRLFFILAEWRDEKFIFQDSRALLRFFFMSDYNFSLAGGVFGFLLVLAILIRYYKLRTRKVIDAVVLSFLFAGVIGFIGTFLGGQICGRPTDLFFGILYTSPVSACPYTTPIFPLSLAYAFASLVLFVVLYMVRAAVNIEGFVGYVGMGAFASILLMGEGFRGDEDMFVSYLSLDLNQIVALVILAMAAKGLYKMFRTPRISPSV